MIKKDQSIHILIISIFIGLVSGVVISFYRFMIHEIEHYLSEISIMAKQFNFMYIFIFIILLILGYIVGKMVCKEPLASGSGIPQISGELMGEINQNPLRVLFVKIFGGMLSALAGLSIGREGPSIQMGAMVGKFISKTVKQNKTFERFFLTSGASAGLAAAFNAPLAGVLFALEELHRYFSKKLIVAIFAASVVADYVSKVFFGTKPIFNFVVESELPINQYYLLILFGIFVALFGFIYFKLMVFFQKLNDKIHLDLPFKMMIYFGMAILFFMFVPDLLGGGGLLFKNINLYDSLVLLSGIFLLKLGYSIFSFSSKVPGGIFFPILILGALLGIIFSKAMGSNYTTLFMIFGMAAYLTTIVRAPITSIVLLLEMSGNINYLLPLSIVCFTSYLILNCFKVEPIYEYLLHKMLVGNKKIHYGKEFIEANFIIQNHSSACDKKIKDLSLPQGCVITRIERGGYHIAPTGETILNTNDDLHLNIEESQYSNIVQYLEKIFYER